MRGRKSFPATKWRHRSRDLQYSSVPIDWFAGTMLEKLGQTRACLSLPLFSSVLFPVSILFKTVKRIQSWYFLKLKRLSKSFAYTETYLVEYPVAEMCVCLEFPQKFLTVPLRALFISRNNCKITLQFFAIKVSS